MNLRQYAAMVWRWTWLIVLGAVIAGAAAYLFSRGQVPVYQAATTLLVNQSKQPTETYDSILTSQRVALTYVEWLQTQQVLEGVAKRLGLPAIPKSVKVDYLRDTQLLVVTVDDTDPARAAAIANTIPEVFGEQSQEIQARRFKESETALQGQMQVVQDEINRTQAAITQLQEAGTGDPGELDRLQSDLRQSQTNYTNLLTSLGSIRLEKARTTDTVYPIQRAETPAAPIRPRPLRDAMLAAVLGAMLAAGVVFLAEYLDDVLKNPDDVQTVLSLPTLGVIPVGDTRPEGELITAQGNGKAIIEAFRVLRTNLQFASVDRPLHSLLITSPAPDEGKSRTAANLAIALAQAGQRVVLIDADLHRPRIHHLLRLPNNVGLTSALLAEEPQPGGLLQQTSVDGLQVLTSGPPPPNAAELLGSARMRVLLAALVAQSDAVILDSPPVTALADAAILAPQVDGVLLVLDATGTRREVALRALQGLQRVQARVVGAVLNRVPTRGAGYYYYYYRHYDREDGSDNGGAPPTRWRRRSRFAKFGAARAPENGPT